VLLKSRHENYRVRVSAIRTIHEFYDHIGEDFLPLLPESVPFISELMEDSHPEVEQACQQLCKTIDDFLKQGGESLKEFLS